MQIALGEKVRADDGTEGRVRKIVTLMDNPMVEGFTIANDVIFLEGVDRGYPLWQLTPVEPEKPKELPRCWNPAGCLWRTWIDGFGFCANDRRWCEYQMRNAESYLQRAAMAWGPESCETCPSYRTWIGCAQCPYVYTKMEFHAEPKPAELMICDHAGECNSKSPDNRCAHAVQHDHRGINGCPDGAKCIPYHEEKSPDYPVPLCAIVDLPCLFNLACRYCPYFIEPCQGEK